MKYFRYYDGNQDVYRIDYDSFHNPFNYISPEFERILRTKHTQIPKFIPQVKRLNTPEIAGYTPLIRNY